MEGNDMVGTMVHLQADGAYHQVYQQVQAYLTQHFTRLPHIDLYYDAQGTTRSEDQRHHTVAGGLVVAEIHASDCEDSIGLLVTHGQVELDAMSGLARPELRMRYGYHE